VRKLNSDILLDRLRQNSLRRPDYSKALGQYTQTSSFWALIIAMMCSALEQFKRKAWNKLLDNTIWSFGIVSWAVSRKVVGPVSHPDQHWIWIVNQQPSVQLYWHLTAIAVCNIGQHLQRQMLWLSFHANADILVVFKEYFCFDLTYCWNPVLCLFFCCFETKSRSTHYLRYNDCFVSQSGLACVHSFSLSPLVV